MRKICLIFLIVAVFCIITPGARAGLADYVQKDDDSYQWRSESTTQLGASRVILVSLTSQTWRGIPWNHWLALIVPEEIKHKDTALLFITGGRNRDNPPDISDSQEVQAAATVATKTGTVVAVLMQVPNQPLFNGLSEDDLISYTYEQYYKMESGGEDWPLLLPMTKSAVSGMDAVQEVVTQKCDMDIERFVVTGASKRGWTTWLTGASDSRVAAIIPMVIDVLNMRPQMAHQLKTYGEYSEMIQEYTKRNIQVMMDTPRGKQLLKTVDPYAYIDELLIPKLVILGSNDPYWCVDSANFYFPALKGEKHLKYVPNAGHGLNMTIVPTIIKFYEAIVTGEKLPNYQWSVDDEGRTEINTECPETTAWLWKAHSPNRDFRQSRWTRTQLEGEGRFTASVPEPDEGWTAYFVELEFPGGYSFCTQMVVLPDRFPYSADGARTTE